MKTRHLKLILLILLVLALATACGDKAKPGKESDLGPGASGEKNPVEGEDQDRNKEPEILEDLELVWSHEYEDTVYGIAVYEEKLAVGEFRATYIHHLSDGSLLNVFPELTAVDNLAFSPDGRFLGLGYSSVKLLELIDNAEAEKVGGWFDSCMAFSPDGLHIAGGDREGIIWIWEMEGLKEIEALENLDLEGKSMADKLVLSVDYHPSGKLLAATHGWEGTVYIWDLEKKTVLRSMKSTASYSTDYGFRFSPKGDKMAYTLREEDEYLLRLLSVDDGKVIRDIVLPRGVKDLDFSPDGSLIAVASYEATTIWDVSSGDLKYRLNHEDDSPSAIKFTSDGGHLAMAYRWDENIELWRLPGAKPIGPPPVDMRTPPALSTDILFDGDSTDLKEEAFVELERLAEGLYASFKKATITFVGHTDSQSDVYTNDRISKERAEAVKDWFQKWADEKGASEWVLLADGKGESQLKVPDMDISDKFIKDAGAVNRRIEIEVEP